jgi:RNA polymerase sigma-70 factor (family 1)
MSAFRTCSDPDLLTLLRGGNEGAFTEIYNRYWDRLYVTAYNRLANEQEAEEAVQNIFMSLWKRKETLQLNYSLGTYLSVAVKYQVYTRLTRLNKEKAHLNELSYIPESADLTTDWLAERELKAQIEKCINALPDKCRIVFLMSREQGMSNAQIAMELNIAEKTVEGRMTRTLTILRSSLQVSLPVLLFLLEKK